jgi:hypothetical protein
MRQDMTFPRPAPMGWLPSSSLTYRDTEHVRPERELPHHRAGAAVHHLDTQRCRRSFTTAYELCICIYSQTCRNFPLS